MTGQSGRPRLSVRGGVGGLAVALDDLDAASAALLATADAVVAQGARLMGALPGPDLVLAGLATAVRRSLLPGSIGQSHAAGWVVLTRALAQCEAAAGRALGPEGAVGQSALLAGLAVSLRGAVTAYRLGERTVDGLVAGARAVVPAAVPVVLPEVVAGAAWTTVVAALDPATRDTLEGLLFANPWLVDAAAGDVLGLVSGVGAPDPRLTAVFAWACLVDGRPYPPRTAEEAVGVLAALAHLAGALDESRAVPDVHPLAPPPDPPLPTSLAGLMTGQADIDREGSEATVRVIEIPRDDGGSAWVVEIPGTQEWGVRAEANPFDAATDLLAMAGDATVAARGVGAALDAARLASLRAAPDDPVLLAGHSQGGILAAALASDPAFRATHRVTHVVTSGAPVARFPIPSSVQVLSLENAQDPVPRLDATANPDRAGWTTVTRDLRRDPGALGRPFAAHAVGEYVETAAALDAVPTGRAASIDAWREGSRPFFAGDAHGQVIVRDYRVLRAPGPD